MTECVVNMECKHLISVVIPVYNVEKYLYQAVESVLNQTYDNLEIILIDDGSTDNSGRICDQLAKKVPSIKVIHKNNEGLGMARNSGLDVATGEYVYFLDSDDYIKCDEIELLYSAIIENKVDIAITGFTSVDDAGHVLGIRRYNREVFQGLKAKTEMLPRIIGSAPDKKDSLDMAAAGSMYSMHVIRMHHIRFVSERELKNEDMVFNIDFCMHANGGCTIDSVGQYYRNNPNSLSHRYQFDRFERDKVFYVEMVKKLKKLGFDDNVINRLRRHFFIHIRIAIRQIKDPRAGFNFLQKKKMIDRLCNDELVQKTIADYPVKLLGFKQKTFILFVKNKMSFFLLVLS